MPTSGRGSIAPHGVGDDSGIAFSANERLGVSAPRARASERCRRANAGHSDWRSPRPTVFRCEVLRPRSCASRRPSRRNFVLRCVGSRTRAVDRKRATYCGRTQPVGVPSLAPTIGGQDRTTRTRCQASASLCSSLAVILCATRASPSRLSGDSRVDEVGSLVKPLVRHHAETTIPHRSVADQCWRSAHFFISPALTPGSPPLVSSICAIQRVTSACARSPAGSSPSVDSTSRKRSTRACQERDTSSGLRSLKTKYVAQASSC